LFVVFGFKFMVVRVNTTSNYKQLTLLKI